MLVWSDILDARKTRPRGGIKAVEEIMLGEEH
jgi:hypothetical protein